MAPKTEKLTLPRGTKIPDHIAIIPDGNRRWARARNLSTLEGHKRGFDRTVELGRAARQLGVHTLTIWGFSTENWDRTPAEISYLMKLYEKLIDNYLKEAKEDGVKIVHLGRRDRLPKNLIRKLDCAQEETKNNKKYVINLAIDYGGHDEIIRVVKQMMQDGVKPDHVNKKLFEKYLDTKSQPYPYVDLLIRTSGEQRTSGLLLWQMEYAEMYWESDHLPDFNPNKLRDAILDYSRRRRRFGGNDQLTHFTYKPEIIAHLELSWSRLQHIPQDQKLVTYAAQHIREQYGLSKVLAAEGGKYLFEAFLEGKKSKWVQSKKLFKKFYKLIRDEVKLAFEPEIAAGLEVNLMQKLNNASGIDLTDDHEAEELSRRLVAEVYRMSDFQAAKAGHLKLLAAYEMSLAEQGYGEHHWEQARECLEKYYKALKERVA